MITGAHKASALRKASKEYVIHMWTVSAHKTKSFLSLIVFIRFSNRMCGAISTPRLLKLIRQSSRDRKTSKKGGGGAIRIVKTVDLQRFHHMRHDHQQILHHKISQMDVEVHPFLAIAIVVLNVQNNPLVSTGVTFLPAGNGPQFRCPNQHHLLV